MTPADIWKPTDPDFIQNPHHAYRKIRNMGSEIFQAKTGDYVILGYQHCKEILQDPSFESGLRLDWALKMAEEMQRRNESFDHVKAAVSKMLVNINPPEHQKIRMLFAKSWPAVHELQRLVEETSRETMAELPEQFDAMDHLCRKIPLRVICKLLGIPYEEAQFYALDGIHLASILGPYLSLKEIRAISKSTKRLQSFLEEKLYNKEYEPTPLTRDVILSFSKEEAINLLLFLFIAGFETTSSLLALCIFHLIKNQKLASGVNEYGAESYINEILRVHSPVQITGRTNRHPIEIDGQQIPENAALTLCIGAANVDPTKFDHAEQLKLDRAKKEHLSFGYGIHYCLGGQLATMEAKTVVEALLPHLEKFKIVNDPVLRPLFTLKSYQSFDLAIHEPIKNFHT